MRVLLAAAMSAVLAGCGGSSSSDSTDELPSNDATVTPANESIPAEIPDSQSIDSETSDTENSALEDATPETTPDTAPDTAALDTPSIPEGDFQVLLHEEELIPGSDGLILTSINQTDHTDDGWFAVSLSYGGEGSSASGRGIWRGRDGALERVLDSADRVQGYPASVSISSIQSISVANDSTVWANVLLGGSAMLETALVEVTPEGDIVGRLRTGDSVPNTATGTVVSIIGDVFVAGDEAYVALESTGARRFLIHATSENQNIVFSSSPDYGPSGEQLPDSIQDCSIGNSLLSEDTLSDSGAILFTSTALGQGCPLNVLMQYEDGLYTLHLATDIELPIGDGSFITRLPVFGLLGFAPDNTALVETLVSTPNDTLINSLNNALWVTSSGEEPTLVAFDGETLPPDFDNFVDVSSGRFNIASGGRVAGLIETGRGNGIFSGTARTSQPYTTYLSVGASQLERLLDEDSSTVPGFGDTSFYSDIENLVFTEAGEIWFQSEASFVDSSEEGSGTQTSFNGVWSIEPGQDPRLVFSDSESSAIFNNEAVEFRDVSDFSTNANGDVFISTVTNDSDNVLLFREGTE